MTKLDKYASYWNQEIVLYRGDVVIDIGTIKEIAERRNIRKDTVYWYTTGAGHRRAANRKDQSKAVRAIKV